MRAERRSKTMDLDPNTALFAIVTFGAGYLMVFAGVHKSALEWRRRRRICPSCGRLIQARACGCAR
jgi:NADH pyrophosphatase NudC (nudix superfamily)